MNKKGGSRNVLEGIYYGAPMRKWENGQPVGASANPDGTTTTTSGGSRKRVKRKYTKRRRSRRNKKKQTRKQKYIKRK